jgi:hypothetical protein
MSSKPSTQTQLIEAFTKKANVKGVSRAALKNYIGATFGEIKNFVLARGLTKLIEAGYVAQASSQCRLAACMVTCHRGGGSQSLSNAVGDQLLMNLLLTHFVCQPSSVSS